MHENLKISFKPSFHAIFNFLCHSLCRLLSISPLFLLSCPPSLTFFFLPPTQFILPFILYYAFLFLLFVSFLFYHIFLSLSQAASFIPYTCATLSLSEPLPTTTRKHYTICCKKSQSCAPEDGQKSAQNMLN